MQKAQAPRSIRLHASLALCTALGLAVLGGAIATVHADVVDPPPMSCPAGSTPSTGHSGPYCAPRSCVTGGVCPGGGTCTAVRQCIETRACGGQTFPDAAPCTIENLVGPCSADGSCAVGVCMLRGACPSTTGSTSGCGCRVGSHAPTGGLATSLALALALGLAVTRRRRSPPAASAG